MMDVLSASSSDRNSPIIMFHSISAGGSISVRADDELAKFAAEVQPHVYFSHVSIFLSQFYLCDESVRVCNR